MLLPNSDLVKLDHMIGWAMLDETLCDQLLHRESRSQAVEWFGLSPRARAYLDQMEDMGTLERFAQELHGRLWESALRPL